MMVVKMQDSIEFIHELSKSEEELKKLQKFELVQLFKHFSSA